MTKPVSKSPPTDVEVEGNIREFFKRNYELLRQEGGHVLAEGAKEQALQQALHYWRKLKGIATTVTDTEVKLSLPGQVSPKKRRFTIEGVVDIVREDDRVRMYDLKTHEERDVRADRELYEDQLNVYAHIWKGIRCQPLDGTAIIATRLPQSLRDALRGGDPVAIGKEFSAWDPVVELPFNEEDVARTIEDFGRCVDAIEDGDASPPSRDDLEENVGSHGKWGAPATFAQVHCKSCDGRFTCRAYRALDRSKAEAFDDAAERALDEWLESNTSED